MMHSAGSIDITIRWINSEDMSLKDLEGVDGIIVPGGFGGRGVEGMINASKYAREQHSVFRYLPRHANSVDRYCSPSGQY